MSSELQSRFFPTSSNHQNYKYKKAAYVEYTDGSFTRKKNAEESLLGPLFKGKVNDEIHVSRSVEDRSNLSWLWSGGFLSFNALGLCLQITLKNMASRPFNVYPNGLSSVLAKTRSGNGNLTQKLFKK